MKNIYTVEAGRWIMRDGQAFVAIRKGENTEPVEADDFCRTIVKAVNNHAELLEALKAFAIVGGDDLRDDVDYIMTAQDIRRARAAIAKAEGKD